MATRTARRTRYAGTHPRRFEEKYKELAPERYPEDVARILASGKTPAGSHRPVMVREVLEALDPKPGETAADVTLGAGGHAFEILPRLLPGGRLVGLDADPIELARTVERAASRGFGPERFVAVNQNMAALPSVLAAEGLTRVDVVLADLGCSSMQLDDPARGFSYKQDGPLDLRLNPRKGKPASDLLARVTEERLVAILSENADEPEAERIASAVVAARDEEPITRTTQLARVVRAALPRSADPAATLARVFQALRIAVNDELSSLEAFLRVLPGCLAPGGRACILTFHSGEDRRVKSALRDGHRAGAYAEVAREVVRPSREEVRANPRAASAKLRWAVRA